MKWLKKMQAGVLALSMMILAGGQTALAAGTSDTANMLDNADTSGCMPGIRERLQAKVSMHQAGVRRLRRSQERTARWSRSWSEG